MSAKLPLYAVDKCQVTVRVPVEVKVRLEGLAEETGLPVAAIAATGVAEMVKDRPFGARELARINEIIQGNIMRRDALKQRKGAF